MLSYSALALSSFKLCFPFTLGTTNLDLGVIGGSLEFSSSSLDIVDRGIFFPGGSISFYLASPVLRASFYSRSSLF